MSLHIGQKIARWTLIGPAEPLLSRGGRSRHRWLCQCDCGTKKVVLAQSLVLAARSGTGGSRSCGCLVIEASLKHGANRHGKPTSEYQAWVAAKKRCENPRNASFENYGGRGIRICQRWSDSFEAFLSDMGPKPDARYSLDRINPEGHYEPGNCRWASMEAQNRNRTTSSWYIFEGQLALLGEIAKLFGISRDQARLYYKKGLLPIVRVARPEGFVPDGKPALVLDLNNAAPLAEITASDALPAEKGLVILD